MQGYDFSVSGTTLTALGSGALWWSAHRLLCVSDLHLGKSERIARRGGTNLPPYETRDTLTRLAAELALCQAEIVVCLGDSFDDSLSADNLPPDERSWIKRLQSGRRWVWIEGNHDPGPNLMGGQVLAELPMAPLTFRHIANPATSGEVSGHFHPKVGLSLGGRKVSRAAFLMDRDRVILPSYGTYTGGLWSSDPVFLDLMRPDALAVMTGRTPNPMPMPRGPA